MECEHKDRTVFIVGLFIVAVIVVMGIAVPDTLQYIGNSLMSYATGDFGWLYNVSTFIFVLFCLWIAFSRYGSIKLGDEAPDYSRVTWFAMLFSAGMGIGLVFWGVAEPLNHFLHPVTTIEGGSVEAAHFAMRKSFLHWGLQPWAGYSVLGMTLAYIQFSRKKAGLISNLLLPFMGDKCSSTGWGKLINILALFATTGGIATSLGLGIQQINSGLSYVYGVPDTATVKIALVVLITVIVIFSTLSGMKKGVKHLSNINVVIAGTMLLLAFIVGPTVDILNTFTNTMGQYVTQWFSDSLAIGDFSTESWYSSWTIFYWAWWIAWTPFVAPFVAKISKGRTIREFVLGVLIAPSIASFFWFSVFGKMGLSLDISVIKEAVQSTSTALFVVVGHYPLGKIISTLTILVLFTFFITSANGATYVLGTLSTNGMAEPPARMKVTWAILQSALALVLLLGSANGLDLLQTISLAAAFPFIFVLFLSMASLVRFVREEKPSPKANKLAQA
ncbi:Glycine betaine transporter OpuD [invertebrate metagenome]|uniref:Glycine betaine transporter OpuD n=1 Tax=invertebrate metagenome TaxID=1711999 RepID=A0A2H9T6P4_9ZZZZ